METGKLSHTYGCKRQAANGAAVSARFNRALKNNPEKKAEWDALGSNSAMKQKFRQIWVADETTWQSQP